MTALLEQALQTASLLPPAAQDDLAYLILSLAGEDSELTPIALSAGERAAVAASKEAAARGEFATEKQVSEVWAKHDL